MNTIIPSLCKTGNNADSSNNQPQSDFVLVETVLNEIRQINKSEQSIKNILATFNQLLKQGFINEANLKDCFESGFEQLRCKIKTHIQETKKNRQWPSHINDIKNAVDRVYSFDLSALTFNEALIRLCKRKWGATLSRLKLFTNLSNETGISLDTLYGWNQKNVAPLTKRGANHVSRLDDFFQAKGKLLSKINTASGVMPTGIPSKNHPSFSLPNKLKKQLNDYVKFRLDGVLPNRKIKFGNKMDERQLRSLRNLKGKEKWTRDGAGECSTSVAFYKRVQSYFNFIAVELKSSENFDWDIRLLFDHEWLYRFKEDCKTRGVFTNPYKLFLGVFYECALDSYMSAYHAFTKDKSSWSKEINLLKEECSAYCSELDKLRKTANGKKNIAFLLASENMEELIIAITNELNMRETYFSGYAKMSSAIIAICFQMLLELPLRVKNMCQLKYIENFDSGDEHFITWPSIVFDKNRTAYSVFIPKVFLKNRNSKRINDMEYCYSDFLTPFITKYLNLRKEFLRKHNICSPYFFFNVQTGHNAFGKKKTNGNLGKLFSLTTYKVLVTLWGSFVEKHNLRGINIHAMRHLSATLFLKHHPENYTALATLLMDDLNTVISTYAQRDDNGNFERIRKFSENFWNNQLKGDNHE